MVKLVSLFLGFLTTWSGTAFAATLLVSPIPGAEAEVSVDVSIHQVRYEVPTDRFYISRDIVAVSWLYESFFASLGHVGHTDFDRDLDPDHFPPSGESGYVLAAGARGAAWRSGNFALNVHAQIHSLHEKVIAGVERSVPGDPEGELTVSAERCSVKSQEILAGVSAVWAPPRWRAYAGLETVPYSNIEMEVPGFESMERSDFISLYAGGGVEFGRVSLDADLTVLGTEGLRIGFAYAF